MVLGRKPTHDSTSRQGVYSRLNGLVKILREHPVLGRAIHTSDNQLVLGLNLATQRQERHPVIFMAMGLVDYAVEHKARVAADVFSRMIEYGESQDLTSYSMMLFHGLHVEGTHDVAPGLSVISWQEARQYMADTIVHSLLAGTNSTGGEPIGAVVSPTKWGPVIVPADYDFEGNWPARSQSFREDALLLIDLMAVTHMSAVRGTGRTYKALSRKLRILSACLLSSGCPEAMSEMTSRMWLSLLHLKCRPRNSRRPRGCFPRCAAIKADCDWHCHGSLHRCLGLDLMRPLTALSTLRSLWRLCIKWARS